MGLARETFLGNPWRESEDRADRYSRKPRLQMDIEIMECGDGTSGMLESNQLHQIHNYEAHDLDRAFPSVEEMADCWESHKMWRT